MKDKEKQLGSKAVSTDFTGRFREIVSDPLNLAIEKDPRAGFLEGNYVYLHNGLKVPISGPHAYYEEFSSILSINRGVHEPLEEFAFQELIKHLPTSPMMLELGAYWGHYSMWLKQVRSDASVHLVEPELENLDAGKHNFETNGFSGEFIQAFVGKGQFSVDNFLEERKIQKVDILHSDIQGFEMEMLNDCTKSLATQSIDYLFVSTHSQKLHHDVQAFLESFKYRIEASCDFEFGTTSFDGFIFASSLAKDAVLKGFTPMRRTEIEKAQPGLLIEYLSGIVKNE